MNIVFAHGKESGPWGTKIRYLAGIAREHGCAVHSPDYRGTMDPTERVRLFMAHNVVAAPLLLVGSSMGGYVSTVVAEFVHPAGLFLMAPALYMPGYDQRSYPQLACPVAIVHGWRDEVVPVEQSLRYAREHSADLHIIDSDHGLNDALDKVGDLFRDFLVRILGGGKDARVAAV